MLAQVFVDLIVFFIGIDYLLKILCALAVLLQVGQELDGGITHRQMHIAGYHELLLWLSSLIDPAIRYDITPIVGFAQLLRPAVAPDLPPVDAASLDRK